MKRTLKTPTCLLCATLAAALLGSAPLRAADAPITNPAAVPIAQVLQDKPFAKEHIALQITDADAGKQQLVLNVARNLLKYYGADQVDVEVVAFGPGLRLLLKGNEHAPQIAALNEEGIRFTACRNSMQALEKTLGHAPELTPVARITPAGIVRLNELARAGYFIDRP